MLEFQGNMVLCANQIWWTAEVEDVFVRISHGQMQAMKNVNLFFLLSVIFLPRSFDSRSRFPQYLKQLNNQLNEVVTLMGADTLTDNDRKKFDMVLTIDVHMRDIVEGFVRDSIIDPSEFEWESQLRFVQQMFDHAVFPPIESMIERFLFLPFLFFFCQDFIGFTIWTTFGSTNARACSNTVTSIWD